jgi:TRAP transporter TAXI family solute receptor
MNINQRSFFVRTFGVMLVVAGGALGMFALQAQAQTKVRLVYGAQPTSTSQYLQAVQHMNAIAKLTGYDIVVQESTGSEENMLRIERQKSAQFGAIDAVSVKARFGNNTDIRTFANYSPTVWQIIVAEDSNIQSLKDLHGKKFNMGPTGGGSTKITTAIFAALGIKPENFEATLDDALDAYADRRIAGLSYRGQGGSATGGVIEAGAMRPVKFVPFSDAEVEVAKKLYPSLTKTFIPANVYPRQPNQIQTIGSWQAGQIGIHKSVSNEVAYTLVKAYFQSRPEVSKLQKALAGVTPENSVSEALLPLHPGVIRYYRELGIVIPDALIPPEAR